MNDIVDFKNNIVIFSAVQVYIDLKDTINPIGLTHSMYKIKYNNHH